MPRRLADPKRCSKCEALKARTEFYPHSTAPRGVSAWCKACTNKMSSANARRDPAKANEATRRSNLKRTFGLTLEDFDAMLERQGGVCAICETGTPGGKGRFHVDHCHRTGVIRGLLCHSCNVGLGLFKDEPSSLRRAIVYLAKVEE